MGVWNKYKFTVIEQLEINAWQLPKTGASKENSSARNIPYQPKGI